MQFPYVLCESETNTKISAKVDSQTAAERLKEDVGNVTTHSLTQNLESAVRENP